MLETRIIDNWLNKDLVEYLENHEHNVEIIGLDSFFHESPHPFIDNAILDAELPLDVTHVVHLAGKTGVKPSWDPEEIKSYYEANVLSSKRIFDTYKRPPYKKDIPILYATSSSVDELKSPYAMTKAMVETIAPSSAIGMKFFTVYGGKNPREDMLYAKALKHDIDELTENKRDFTHIDFVCEAIHALLLCGEPDRIYDIGTGNPRTPKEFLEELDILPTTILSSIPIVESLDESQFTCADSSEIEKVLFHKRQIEKYDNI